MNNTIKELFEQYKKNYTEWNELEKQLMKTTAREEWFESFYNTMNSFQSIYDSNKGIIDEIGKLLNHLDSDVAEELFNGLSDLYNARCRDAEFLIFVNDKLINFYEEAGDTQKLISLYSIRANNKIQVGNPEGLGRDFDMSDTLKVMSYIDQYSELDEHYRYRIWVSYYNFIARLPDMGVIGPQEALDAYDKIMALEEREDIAKLDENIELIQNIKKYMQQAMFVCIALIDKTDDKGRERFYSYIKRFFENNIINIQSLYELPAELYACHLFIEYMEGINDIDKTFSLYLDYIKYKTRILQTKVNYDQDEVLQSINAIRYLTSLGKLVSDRNNVNEALAEILSFVQSKWVKSNLVMYDKMSDMLAKACISLISFDAAGIDKEKCITQLIIQRDIHLYIHAKITAEISMALYREITVSDIAFFDEVKSLPSHRWKNFLYYSSMFHNIGKEECFGTVVYRSRPLFEQEIKRHRLHTVNGASVMKSVEGINRYAEVISGHHTYYNGENSADYKYNRQDTDLNAFTDIVALATYIAKETDFFWDFEKKSVRFRTLLQNLRTTKNTRFNGRLVDALLNSEVLQKEIEKIVTEYREDIVFDVYHNWEKIQLSQDEESMLSDCMDKYYEYRTNRDEEAFAPALKQFEYLAENSKSDTIRCQALYIIMNHKFVNNRFSEGIAIGAEVERLMKKTRNYEMLVSYYFDMGRAEGLRNNVDIGMSHLLAAIWYSEKAPGTEDIKNLCYLSIACILASKYNYEKGKEYFDKCNIESLNIDEQLQYICMKGYCHVQLGLYDKVRIAREKLLSLLDLNPDHVIYPMHVYLAIFASVIGDDEGLEKSLADLRKQKLTPDLVAYFSDEMFMYIEFLAKLGRYKEAAEVIDEYSDLCESQKEYSVMLTKLLNVKISVAAKLNGYTDISKTEEKLRKAFYDSQAEEATRVGELVKSLQEEIEFRAEHEEILINKEALEESVKMARSDSEYKSQFLSSMSHEIRTPINAILGFNEMIIRESSESHVLQYASDIENAGKQLLGIINDILDYSKIEAGKMEIVPQNYRTEKVVNDIKSMIEPKLREKGIDFIVNYNNDIPDELRGDDLRIKQILINLLTNAYKYTQKGHVAFNIDFKKIDEESISLKFSVEDTGIGLKKEQIEKIANPFERFEMSKNHSVEGTGLGMNIVTRLLEQMDSKLVIESKFGIGSTFSFEIKQNVVEWKKNSQFRENRKNILKTSSNVYAQKENSLHAPNAKILVVDDNAVNLKVAVALLKRTGMQVTSVMSGRECLELCSQNEYHVILLDHMMPDMDGVETLEHIRKDGGLNTATPVIALTANVADSVEEFYMKAGFDSLLTKPINVDRMEELITSFLPEYLVE